ncbi:MAG TPA: hypothetical protein DCQ06_11975 [Myxococcales bacterium]|nr:hypothetical protein [Myxococcales bacterium]
MVAFKKVFHVVSLRELFGGASHRDKMTVAISFDDGYRNNLLYALPILRRLEIPATLFVTTLKSTQYEMLWPDYLDVATYLSTKPIVVAGRTYVKRRGVYVDDDGLSLKERCKSQGWSLSRLIYDAFPEAMNHRAWSDLKDYWQLLDADELRQLAAEKLIDIGLHGHFHQHLGRCSVEQAQQSLTESKAILEGWIGRPVSALAYPDGSYSRPLLSVAQSLGLTEQYAVQYLHHDDRADTRILERLTINPFVSADVQSKALIDGHYGTARVGRHAP